MFQSAHIGNPAIAQNVDLDYQTFYENKFSKLMSYSMNDETGMDYVFDDNAPGNFDGFGAINVHTGDVDKGGDYVVVPRLKNLDENFRIGDEQLIGHEVEQEVIWRELYIEQVRMGVRIRDGKGTWQRNKKLMEGMKKKAKKQLAKKFAGYINDHGLYAAILEGKSRNIQDSSEYSVGQVSNPNFFYLSSGDFTQVDFSGGAYTNLPGTAGYETAIATAVDTYSGATPALTHDNILQLKHACIEKRIQKLATKDGFEFWVMIVHPRTASQFAKMTDFRLWQSQAKEYAQMNPIFTGAIGFFEGFLVIEDQKVPSVDKETPGSAYNASTNPLVYGATKPTINDDTRDWACNVILGANAVSVAKPVGLHFDEELTDYKNRKAQGGSMIIGMDRNDFHADQNNNTKGLSGDFEENTGSLVFLTNKTAV